MSKSFDCNWFLNSTIAWTLSDKGLMPSALIIYPRDTFLSEHTFIRIDCYAVEVCRTVFLDAPYAVFRPAKRLKCHQYK